MCTSGEPGVLLAVIGGDTEEAARLIAEMSEHERGTLSDALDDVAILIQRHEHTVLLEGPDIAGHYEWSCVCGDNATGLEPAEVIREAKNHGRLAAGQDSIIAAIRSAAEDDG